MQLDIQTLMSALRNWVILTTSAVVAAIAVYAGLNRPLPTDGVEVARASSTKSLQWKDAEAPVGLCPWRDPAGDRRRFFADSTGYRDETLVLSAFRQQLQQRLGRPPTGEDNALIVHRIMAGLRPDGMIVTRRVRGENGLIELVLAVSADQRVIGARVQRHREPPETARYLESSAWIAPFAGKDYRSAAAASLDQLDVSPAAQESVTAIAREIRTTLILLDVATHVPGGVWRMTHDTGPK